MKKICFVLTAEFAVKAFLLGHLRALSKYYDVTVIVNTNNPSFLAEQGINAKVVPLAIARDISLIADVSCLLQLVKLFYQQSFSAVHSITPKAGILAMMAAYIVRVPLRVHTFTGQVWVTKGGFKRLLLKMFDRLIAFLATNIIVDSYSQRQFLLEEGVITKAKSVVFGSGSVSGVDLSRFKYSAQVRLEVRNRLNINADAIVFLFLGRLNLDKGVLDLANAFSKLPTGSACLLFVGPDEQNMQIKIESILANNASNVRFVGYTNVPENYMSAVDVLFLPSYREGFGSVVIEAAAVGIPTVASRIYGVCDAVVDGETGLLHEPHAVNEIEDCMKDMMSNRALRLKLGKQAQTRAVKDFDSQLITQAWVNFYHENVQ